MKKLPRDNETRPPFGDDAPLPSRLWQRFTRAFSFDVRDRWWRLLDAIETRRALRWTLSAMLAATIFGVASWLWVYPWWMKRNAVSVARQWLAVGRLDYAAEAVKQAIVSAPENVDTWRLAAELARRQNDKVAAKEHSHHAATLAPNNIALATDWAADALLADAPEEAERALATLPVADAANSSAAHRIAGELARRRQQLTVARDHFENALRLDGPLAIDEVPLGIILLSARDPAERQRGLTLLKKWTADPTWGAESLRPLLNDAILHDDRAAMLAHAEALRAHPRCTFGDLPSCLLALSKTDATRFATVLAAMEKDHAADATNVATLIGWLNQIGRSADAVAWAQTLPATITHQPPAVVAVAEALRQSSRWTELDAWTETGDWGRSLDSLRIAYALQAARQLARDARAKDLWATLLARAPGNGASALFTADTIYHWGLREEAVALLWIAAEQPGVALTALGTLARHYQTQRDAEGQYRAFRQIYALRVEDAAIANNYAFFAALLGKDARVVEKITRENLARHPGDLTFRATSAFVLTVQNHAEEALALLKPVASEAKNSAAVAFAYGLALAGAGQKSEARVLLASLDPRTLTTAEIALINRALAGSVQ